LRSEGRTATLLIAASMRAAPQVAALAGVDVYTMPPKVAGGFLAAQHAPGDLQSRLGRDFPVAFADERSRAFAEPLWAISPEIRALAATVAGRGAAMTGDDLREADADTGAGLFHRFTETEAATIRADGKIPVTAKWMGGGIALDDLMTQSALQSFSADQAALDARLMRVAA